MPSKLRLHPGNSLRGEGKAQQFLKDLLEEEKRKKKKIHTQQQMKNKYSVDRHTKRENKTYWFLLYNFNRNQFVNDHTQNA